MTLAPDYRAPYLGPQGAWTRGNAAVAALLAAASLGGIATAWVGASGKTHLDDEIPWLAFGVVAFAVGGIAAAVWLGRGLRSIRTERVALRRRLIAMDIGRSRACRDGQRLGDGGRNDPGAPPGL